MAKAKKQENVAGKKTKEATNSSEVKTNQNVFSAYMTPGLIRLPSILINNEITQKDE